MISVSSSSNSFSNSFQFATSSKGHPDNICKDKTENDALLFKCLRVNSEFNFVTENWAKLKTSSGFPINKLFP